jgi:hypothetical protein
MAASIKISELNSLTNLTDVDLFLVSDMESGTSKKVSYSSLKSNVTSDVSSALTNLTNVVTQNRTDAETLIETVRAALQASVDTNTAAVDALDVDIAPETLNSINELSAAMGDDPNFLAAKLNVANPAFTGIITGPDIDINNGSLTVASSGGVFSNVGFFSTGLLSIGGNASFTDNVTFSSGNVNFLDVIKIDDVELTASATELNYVAGVTSNIQTQLDSIQTSLTGDNANQAELDAYKAYVDEMNFQLMLAYDTPTYIDTLFGG